MLRGKSFVGEYMGGKKRAIATAPGTVLAREPTMLHGATLIPPQSPSDGDKLYTVVFDLDETLVYAREEQLYARAHAHKLLTSLDKICEIIVWTAGSRAYAKAVVKELNVGNIIKHLIYRDRSWFSAEDYTKDLRRLGRDMDRVLIVENTPQCVNLNPNNGIIVADYEGGEMKDASLQRLLLLVRELVASGQTVPDYLAATSYVTRQQVGKGLNKLSIYFLAAEEKGSKVVKRNRDLPATMATSSSVVTVLPEDEAEKPTANKRRSRAKRC